MIPAPDPFVTEPRTAFAGYRPGGTAEVTTLGPEAEARTHDAALNFGDLLDIANPLQHIPGLASLYRGLTGDAISPTARILGAALYTGPVGFVFAAADVIFEEASGRYLGDALVAAVTGGSDHNEAEPATTASIGAVPDKDADLAVVVASEPARLEGSEALAALARDLGARSRPESVVSVAAPAPPAAAPDSQRSLLFQQNMAKALDKYRALAQARQTALPGAVGPQAVAPGLRTTLPKDQQPL